MDKINIVDLHLHSSFSSLAHDSISWVSLKNTLYSLNNNNVKIICFTDHDFFNYDFVLQAQDIIKQSNFNIKVFPGVEMTIRRQNGSCGHCLYIFDHHSDEMMKDLQNKVNRYKNRSNGVSPNVWAKAIADYTYTIIPHVSKADSNMIFEDLKSQVNKINYIEGKISSKSTNFIKKSQKDIKTIMMSDTHFWDNNRYVAPNSYCKDINISSIKQLKIEMRDNE